MSTEIILTLMSGQLILVLWQIYKEIKEAKEKKEREKDVNAQEVKILKQMVFKLYRDNLESKILKTYGSIDNDSPRLKEYLMGIQDDMDVYLKSGGNGTVKALYLRFADYVKEKKGEPYYLLLVIESLNM